MDPATSRTLQLQLEATLRLLILLSPMLSSNDVMMARIRLTESDIILGQLLAERDAAPNNTTPQRTGTRNNHPGNPSLIDRDRTIQHPITRTVNRNTLMGNSRIIQGPVIEIADDDSD